MSKKNMSKAERRKQALQHRRKKSMKTLAILVVVIAVVSIGVYYVISMNEESQNSKSYEVRSPSARDRAIDVQLES